MDSTQPPDYEAIAHRLIIELEELRGRYDNARFSFSEEVSYWLRVALDFARDPSNAVLTMILFMALVMAGRGLIKYLKRRSTL